MFLLNFLKIIGPRPQGVWMGILTSVGSLARSGLFHYKKATDCVIFPNMFMRGVSKETPFVKTTLQE
jgi:hypothetical protein